MTYFAEHTAHSPQCQEWGQAQLYFNRAAVLVTSGTKRDLLLQYKMCQVGTAVDSIGWVLTAGTYGGLLGEVQRSRDEVS